VIVFEEPTLAEAVGLKHIIEDGLAILDGRKVGEGRREFVMRDLRDLLDQAIRGSHIASQATLFLGEGDRQAFGSFTLLDRYLGARTAPGWLDQAPNVLRVFDKLQQAIIPQEAEKKAAQEILGALLTQISTEHISETETRDIPNSMR
jgi:hypothetical protein